VAPAGAGGACGALFFFSFLFFFWRASRHQKSAKDGTYLKSLPIRSYLANSGLFGDRTKTLFWALKGALLPFLFR
jgi:hypothetical protein